MMHHHHHPASLENCVPDYTVSLIDERLLFCPSNALPIPDYTAPSLSVVVLPSIVTPSQVAPARAQHSIRSFCWEPAPNATEDTYVHACGFLIGSVHCTSFTHTLRVVTVVQLNNLSVRQAASERPVEFPAPTTRVRTVFRASETIRSIDISACVFVCVTLAGERVGGRARDFVSTLRVSIQQQQAAGDHQSVRRSSPRHDGCWY